MRRRWEPREKGWWGSEVARLQRRKETRKGSVGSIFVCLKCFCSTFKLWRCMEWTKCNCNFDHWNLSRGNASSNHRQFTPLMTMRELIYPGDKQIKALLSPASCHTTAYINIFSWAIQVTSPFSQGLTLHLPKPINEHRPSCSSPPCYSSSSLCYFSRHVCHIFLRIFNVNSERSNILIPSDIDVWLADRQGGVRCEEQKWADIFGHVTLIYGPVQDSNLRLQHFTETTDFIHLHQTPLSCSILQIAINLAWRK